MDKRAALLAWYDRNRRDLPWRRTTDPYAIWLSEVMLQQTQVKTVIPHYLRFLGLFPDVAHLAQADEQQVIKAWEGLGYYRRAYHLHHAARIVREQMDGRLPDDWQTLRRLPGVGDYIAAAVLSIAFDRPFAVLDGNVKRVLARLFTIAAPVNHSASHGEFQSRADRLLDRRCPGQWNQAMMELGALVCLPRNPRCRQCPLAADCLALAGGKAALFPQRRPRRALPLQQWVAAAVWKNGRLLLSRRPAKGLLGGLWELPGGIADPDQEQEAACRDRLRSTVNLEVGPLRRLTTIDHTFTHLKIRLTVFECRWMHGVVRLDGPAAFEWIDPLDIGRFALHKVVSKAWPHVVTVENRTGP